MARVLGYGGLANTNGSRNFAGKEFTDTPVVAASGGGTWAKYHARSQRLIPFAAVLLAEWIRRIWS